MKQVFRVALGDVEAREAGQKDTVGSEAGLIRGTVSRRFEAELRCQPVAEVWLHSAGAASRPAALLLLKYRRYAPSSRLAGRAHRRPRCDARLLPRAVYASRARCTTA